jgi:ankyrin repeat protein
MATHTDAVRPNLEFYRKQAKDLLKAARSGDASALHRLRRQSPRLAETGDLRNDGKTPALHDAQLTIAREQGFSSWPRFRAFIGQSALDFHGLVAAFIEAAVSDLRQAEEMLRAHPTLAGAGFYSALVLGDWKRVQQELAETPAIAIANSGPQDCEPLLYVCFSRFANGRSSRAGDLAQTARILMRHGADPDVSFVPKESTDSPLSCLYAATGLNNHPALALALLEAGANPNDSESLYHSTEHHDLACMKILLRHGATPAGTNALKHILDREDTDGLQLLLAAGANPDEANNRGETALHWAVGHGRSAQSIAALLDAGADLNAQRNDGRTAYALAVLSGLAEVATLLAARGAKTNVSALDQFVGACATADPIELNRLLVRGPEGVAPAGSEQLLPDLATSHRTSAVRGLLAAGIPVDTRGELGGTALHWACWKGYADLVKLLLDHGASLEIEDQQFHGTPPGWFGHGVHNCGEDSGDYAQVARLLIGAGAKIPSVDLPTGKADVDAVLRQHGLIF